MADSLRVKILAVRCILLPPSLPVTHYAIRITMPRVVRRAFEYEYEYEYE